ncbi:MAG: DUF2306 domain-containing protein [Micrococcus sp.]|nr:DUF2306 domain-containing protein [Micrococcus sp.]
MDAFGHLLSTPILLLHVIASVYALAVGPINLLRRRRDRTHRGIGRTWVLAMFVSALTSFAVQQPFLAFSWLHALSLWTMASISLGVAAIRRGNRPAHVGHLVGSYLGLWAAFLWAALAPDRTIAQIVAQAPVTAGVTGLLAVTAAVGTYWVFRGPHPQSGPHATQEIMHRA